MEIAQKFIEEVNKYLERCKKAKINPTANIYGSIPEINIDPKVHEMAIAACKLQDKSIEQIIEEALRDYIR